MNGDVLGAIAGSILSLAFSYIPGLRAWYDGLVPANGSEQEIEAGKAKKRLVMAGLLLLVSGGAFALSCADIVGATTCDKPGAIGLVSAFLSALMANQATFSISKFKKPE